MQKNKVKFIGIPRCPYCKKSLNYIVAWLYKTKGEYRCPKCSYGFIVKLSPLMYIFGIIAILLCALIAFITLNMGTFLKVGVFLTPCPYIFFELISPFFVYLVEPPIVKRKQSRETRYDENYVPIKRTNDENHK